MQSEGSPARARRGPTVGPPGSPGRKKSFFPKLFPDHLGCSNTCFWPGLSPWWRVLGHGKSQNALKMGRFKTKNGSKMGQKRVFPKVILDHFGCSNTCFWPGLSPWWRVLGHGKSQNALKMGRFKTKNGSKMGQKRVFPKVILDHFGCSNTCFSPVLSPWWRVLGHGKCEHALKMGRFKTKNGSKWVKNAFFQK